MEWSQEHIAELRRMRAAGMTYPQIAKALGRSTDALMKAKARYLVEEPWTRSHNRDECIRRLVGKMPLHDIANRFRMSVSELRKRLEQLGIEAPPARAHPKPRRTHTREQIDWAVENWPHPDARLIAMQLAFPERRAGRGTP